MMPTPLFSQNNTNNNSNGNNNVDQTSFQNSSANQSSLSNNNGDDDDQENTNNKPGMTRTMPSKTGTKHTHMNAYVVSTIFVLVEMYDANTLNMAASSLKILDDQCQLLNANHGNIPQIVFVALNVEQDENDSSVESFPEVLIDDVIELSRRLHTAKGRVDEVTLVM